MKRRKEVGQHERVIMWSRGNQFCQLSHYQITDKSQKVKKGGSAATVSFLHEVDLKSYRLES